MRRLTESYTRRKSRGIVGNYTEDVADLRAILRLIESGALHEATEAIDCLDTLVRDQIPIHLYDAIIPGE